MVQGRGIDASLNETGKKQAESFYDMYKDIRFDKIYTSKLKRTEESVTQFIKQGIPYESLEGLDEISWGSHEGQPYDEVRHAAYEKALEDWSSGRLDENVGGGESPNQLVARQKEVMQTILSNENERTILIATHGRAMRILICHLLNYPLKEMDIFEHENLCLYILNYTGSMFNIEKCNSTKHLD